MEDQELLALIDRYLDGTLTDSELTEVERQIAENPDFRAEVQLQRELREAYQDTGRLRLRSAMADIMEESLSEEAPSDIQTAGKSGQVWKWILLLILVILIGIAVWYGSRSNEVSPVNPPSNTQPIDPSGQPQEDPDVIPGEEDPEPSGQDPQPQETPPSSPTRPIAMADPIDLVPNQTMEDLIGGISRSVASFSVTIDNPVPDAAIPPGNASNISISFSGTVQNLKPGESASLVLLLFDNKDSKVTETSFIIQGEATDPGFALSASLPARLGLYYYLIETEAGDLLAAGRFTIEN